MFEKIGLQLKELFALLNKHLCMWCCCRFVGVTDISFYKLSVEEAIAQLSKEHSGAKEEILICSDGYGSACSGCFGVLLVFNSEDFLDKVEESVKTHGFEFEHFCCSLALPIASTLRDFSFLLMCSDVCPAVYNYMPIEQIPTVKDVWKWMCGSKLEKRFGRKFSLEFLDILIEFEQDELSNECNFLTDSFRDFFMKRKGQKSEMFTRNNVSSALQSVSRQKLKTILPLPPKRLTQQAYFTCIKVSHNPVYIAGRYNKFSRNLSQSPWIIEGERKGETSVSELIADPLMSYTQADSNYFSSSGREDVDVRMLGTGRPFMIQIMNPRRVLNQAILNEILEKINETNADLIAVRDLQIVSRESCDTLKDLEAEKRKTYSALCISDSPISQQELDKLDQIKDLVLNQMTPIRVLHRRPLANRPRTVYWLNAKLEPNSDVLFSLTLETQGGTYVKEFVHSDFGRTAPNLGALLGNRQMDILTLDVLSVHVGWPPSLQPIN